MPLIIVQGSTKGLCEKFSQVASYFGRETVLEISNEEKTILFLECKPTFVSLEETLKALRPESKELTIYSIAHACDMPATQKQLNALQRDLHIANEKLRQLKQIL